MKQVILPAAIALSALSFAGGAWYARNADPTAHAQEARAREARAPAAYACPMHPQYRSDVPGSCPSCGMPLEPTRTEPGGATQAADALPPGAVHVSAERQQVVGVRLGLAERIAGMRMLRTTGSVAPNENATYPIVAGASGWIRNIRSATTGSQVKKNEVLASFYAPEFITAQQSYYAGLEMQEQAATMRQQLQHINNARQIETVERYADTLRNLGVGEVQLAAMAAHRQFVQDISITSPVDGFVLQRNISPGLRFDRGFEFYRLADLRTVWILADVYQQQLPFIQRGVRARATTPQENRSYDAIVSHAEPIFDEDTLTLKVRLETANPGLVLKPGMFVDVEFPIELPETLVVPADAIVDSGARKTVFVDRGNGYFEPRQVETGWRIAGDVEVTKGLMPGERIVISGTFLIDSESRMKAAARGILGDAAVDPVCGMHVDEERASAAGRMVQHGDHAYYFCSDDCKTQFEKQPSRFIKEAAASAPTPAARTEHQHAQAMAAPHKAAGKAEADSATDPMCGMTVKTADAAGKGRTSIRDGVTHYFCSDHCKQKFESES